MARARGRPSLPHRIDIRSIPLHSFRERSINLSSMSEIRPSNAQSLTRESSDMRGVSCAPARRVRRPPSATYGGISPTVGVGIPAGTLHQCTDARKTPGSLPFTATFRRGRPSFRAETVAPHVESAPEDGNWPKRFPATEKPRGSDRRKLPLWIAAAVHHVKPKSFLRFSVPDLVVWRPGLGSEFGARKEYAPEFLPGRGKVNASHA